ncbi:hypothetical protein [Parvibaculum sp.]|uniref:Eco57I restriction-modification methylase domain-containing protein n=1 Tax=Parvibaculum sp. TaxID=2024848 RepID=UPI000C8E795A|nr:hypothetical protein [Parvibaculum sp.]MAB13294.1 SAM-dependent methyltransferase [Parvibaculum sp.]
MDQTDNFELFDSSSSEPVPKPGQRSRQSEFGQYMTSPEISNFMAGMFTPPACDVVLLDAGAGQASLTTAFVQRWSNKEQRIEAHAYEIDVNMLGGLRRNMSVLASPNVDIEVVEGDFLEHAAHMIALSKGPRYTHAILNPPYGKISASSLHRKWCRVGGLETVNLYSGFIGLSLKLMRPGGEVVAIIPRSFCNGPYYLPFRRLLLGEAAIRRIHLFGSRDRAFKEDAVLQENVIIHLVRGAEQGDVTISTSTDRTFSDMNESIYPFESIVFPDDNQSFIHVPSGEEGEADLRHHATLEDIGLKVSTGPVVDFRVRPHLRQFPEFNDAPLLYPGHFVKGNIIWPRPAFKKPNAIARNVETERLLYPAGFYVLVKRFSSKEEKKRVVAYLIEPEKLGGYEGAIGFENHFNVFHDDRKPLDEATARGLAIYLNGSAFDAAFRRFNGHTQVNATDLRNMTYPDRATIVQLGEWARNNPSASQEEIDKAIIDIE